MNSSLHGYPIFDPHDQSMNPFDFGKVRSPTSSSLLKVGFPEKLSHIGVDEFYPPDASPSLFKEEKMMLPPPPVKLAEGSAFDCDICGENIKISRRREWT